jgi:lauroyl/myristoyl acyltransferase
VEPVSAAYRLSAAYLGHAPRSLAELTAAVASSIAAVALPERRLIVERNLLRVHGPGFGGRALRRAVHQTFRSYGRYWADSFRLPGLSPAAIDAGFAYEGLDHVLRARAEGFGPILVLPHVGGWEWAGAWLTQVARIPVTVVVEPVEPSELFEFFVDYRRDLGMNIVPLGERAGAEILRAIRERHVVCLLADRDIQGDGVPVELFGEATTLPAGPAALALRSGAPLLPTAVYFRGRGHHAVVGPPVAAERQGRLRDDVARITRDVATRLEELIRAAPEQWHLQQPNWPSDRAALAALATGP